MPEMTVQDWLGAENTLGIDIWEKKYRYADESFEQWLDRVSGNDPELRQLIIDKKFLFGGRILANRGIPDEERHITYSNCYVIEPPEDNIESIFDCSKKLARTYSYGGGCGIDISKLAPKGAVVRNAAKESSGAVSFMDLYSLVTGLISQNGRRGALMISMDVGHPDILDFIDIKKDLDRVTKANISVRASDVFMQAVEDDDIFTPFFTRPETGDSYSFAILANDMLNKIAQNNWEMGEPGMLFWDRIKDWNMLSGYDNFEYAGVNPCAEEPLPAGGSCLLGSMNLVEFVDDNGNFDFDGFSDAVFSATVALNRVLDEGLPKHPLEEQRRSVDNWRQVGLGVMAIADMLIRMGVVYGSDEAIDICRSIAYTMLNSAVYASANLAALNKAPFPMYDYQALCKSRFFQENISDANKEFIKEFGMYNSQLLTIAPTGTISTMLGVSGGIEPIFAKHYTRKTESLHGEDVYYKVYTPIVKQYMDEHFMHDDENLPPEYITSQEIPPSARIAMQASWQQFVDASISSTINLPEEATPQDIKDIYMMAWRFRLKGITVFRDGCQRAAILSTEKKEESEKAEGHSDLPMLLEWGDVLAAQDNLVGKKRKLTTGCGSLHCTAFFDPETGKLMETYLSRGSTGGCANSYTGLSRMISLAARAGVGLHVIIDQLNSCGICPSYAVRRATRGDTSPGACCPIAIGKALKEMQEEMLNELYPDKQGKIVDTLDCTETPSHKSLCPECGAVLVHEGGCDICKDCGWSHCS